MERFVYENAKAMIKVVLEQLSQKGIKFEVKFTDGFTILKPDLVLEYIDNPDKIEAECNGIPLEDLLEYKKNRGGYVQCSFETEKAGRCKNNVKGISPIFDAQTWSYYKHQKLYCHKHELKDC